LWSLLIEFESDLFVSAAAKSSGASKGGEPKVASKASKGGEPEVASKASKGRKPKAASIKEGQQCNVMRLYYIMIESFIS
jgi:hypothetical protein